MVELTYLSLKKTTFLFVFSTYLPVFLFKFWAGDLVGCVIQFRIQRVPTLHTFDGPRYPKNKKYLKNVMMTSSSHFFKYFLFLGYRGTLKVCNVGTRWMWNQILHPTSSPDRNLSKNTMRYVENMNKKVVFFNDKYVNSTIMVDLFYWNSIGSWIPTHRNLFWHVFL